ncbi:MAG: phosphotransferase [Brevibacterium sp.]|uniref:phosphotransferase n=1 Tax=Brevibacterium sp. TaxID=1701 RepID=UPI002647E8E0|nr:phosphotransferase [Brevibacterium sp.]MDN5806988.1 phosphotransferase [Brevibacterium sp.]MDN5832956.1 phosphotransferase [Brevibacterium sp.]MDN5875279.1 phosphotransferase [Brevibacterium sp.]MDN5908376.1 phosphotransferase [Brevibacterium sp.]MDN6134181.1 phosphotransferase [Brevibacterium sp.]
MTPEADTSRSGAPVIPDAVTVDGERWTVRRAWPASRDRIAIEAEKNSAIRAGLLSVDRVTMFDAGRDPKLPGFERLLATAETSVAGGTGNRLISHRPGKRAVIRLADGSFAKCVRPSRAADIIAGQGRAEAFRNGFALPNVLTADDSTVVLSALPGVELHDPGRLGADWAHAWGEALDAWALAAHNSAAASATKRSLPIHSAAAEAQVLDDWRTRAHDLLGPRTAEVDSLITQVRADLLSDGGASAGDGNWGPIHRDLHDKQIMWDPVGGPGLLDVDTACLGERELDLGNLRAHARWRTHQEIWTDDEAEAVIGEISRVTSESGLDPRRVSAYERSTLLRLVCVYAFRPRFSDRTGVLLEAAR